jgi:DNA-binding LacI/PurR family transcriptional regulator
MRATIRQVADKAGVSRATVSNVLRGVESRASQETRNRVLEAAQHLQYLPVRPPTAQNRHIETRIVTLVPEHHDITHHELDLYTYEGVVEGARKHGFDVLTMVRDDDEWGLGREEIRYLDRRSDGFIFAVSLSGQWESAVATLAQNRIPSVVCYSRDVPEGIAWVDVDNSGAMHQAVEHLVQNGHTRIAYLAGPPNNFDAKQRRDDWIAAMQEKGLAVDEQFIVQGSKAGYVKDTAAIASVGSLGVTAVICFNDTLALALWDALEEQGLKVPQDISIIGVDNRPEAAERDLTSIAHSFADVGRLAMDAWVELKNGGDVATCCKVAPVSLVPRGSVRNLVP